MRRLLALAVGLLMPVTAARADAPMNYLASGGTQGGTVTPLLWASTTFSLFIIFAIALLVVIGSFRKRARGHEIPPAARHEAGLTWIAGGVAFTVVGLLVFMVWTVHDMAASASAPVEPQLTIEVRAHQWWWEFRYLDKDPSRIFTTANELHIPVGQPVRFRLVGTDVIHSFWLPQLGGKTDVIPGQTNTAWLEAKVRGVYRGQCAEYCGAQHAHMALLAYADAPADFVKWWAAQLQPAAAPATEEARTGASDFIARCGACHTLRGTAAGGRLGPDLSHLMSRSTLAAGTLPNTVAYLSGWISNPQTVKPDAQMPNLDLSAPELAAIRSYLLAQR